MSSVANKALSPRLPPELTDYAIDFLHDDIPALRAVALTSHTTLPSARYHLFYAASLHSTADLARFTSLITSHPHLAPYVQSLTLSKATEATPAGRIPTVDTSSAWETTVATSTLPAQLPSLKTLHLNHFLSFWQPATFSILSFSAFKTVQTLHVSDSSLRSFTEMRLLLAALPDVRALVLEGTGIGMKAEDLTWLASTEEKDAAQRQQLLDGTRTPPDLRQRVQSPLFKDALALNALRVAYRSSTSEAFSPSLSVNALTVLVNYLAATPSVFSLEDAKFEGFEGLGEEMKGVVKGFKDGLVKARKERVDWD
ncbi:hypothetical protein EIP91_010248 [Steccherinum ochraceum]|uniref:Uncharacterized protein n=1 Tax=Steccherinum ochraceum TaxID=92696 RepID=A0A4R0R3E7_9APHY|nr:hypothetical protein EIP91_010248 [Steccherinum ochraceum]